MCVDYRYRELIRELPEQFVAAVTDNSWPVIAMNGCSEFDAARADG